MNLVVILCIVLAYLVILGKYTGIILQTLQNKDLILTLETILRAGISSIMGDRYVKSDENKKILYADAIKLYGHSMN